MDFRLSDDQVQLQQAAAKAFADSAAVARTRAAVDGEIDWDRTMWDEMRAFGLPAILVPERHGGLGLGMVELALVAEQAGYAASAIPLFGHALATTAILYGGDEAQQARWLPGLADGSLLATVAIAEPGARWQHGEWLTVSDGDALTGTKSAVPFGESADLLVVGIEGGRLAVVEAGARGLEVRAVESQDRTRPLAETGFSATPAALLCGDMTASRRMMDAAGVLLAADAFGGASRIVEMTRDYTMLREAFGARLAAFQGVKHQLANMAVEVEPTRGLFWFSAYAFDRLPDRASHAAALAKAQTCEVYLQSARMGAELHGGIAFTWEHDLHIWLKRAMFDFAWGGASEAYFQRAFDMAGL